MESNFCLVSESFDEKPPAKSRVIFLYSKRDDGYPRIAMDTPVYEACTGSHEEFRDMRLAQGTGNHERGANVVPFEVYIRAHREQGLTRIKEPLPGCYAERAIAVRRLSREHSLHCTLPKNTKELGQNGNNSIPQMDGDLILVEAECCQEMAVKDVGREHGQPDFLEY